MAYQLIKGRFLVIHFYNNSKTKRIAKITDEDPLTVVIDSSAKPVSRDDYQIDNMLSKKIQQAGLKSFIDEEKILGNTYPLLLREVLGLYPEPATPILDSKKVEYVKEPVVTAPEEIIILEPICEAVIEKKIEPIVAPDESPTTEETPVVLEAEAEEVSVKPKRSGTKVSLYNKKILGELYFQLYLSLQKETRMKIGHDFTITKDSTDFVFFPSKGVGKLSIEKRLEAAWKFFKERYGNDAVSPYFPIELPDEMPPGVITLNVANEYKRILAEREIPKPTPSI